jgi:hypothetical protein
MEALFLACYLYHGVSTRWSRFSENPDHPSSTESGRLKNYCTDIKKSFCLLTVEMKTASPSWCRTDRQTDLSTHWNTNQLVRKGFGRLNNKWRDQFPPFGFRGHFVSFRSALMSVLIGGMLGLGSYVRINLFRGTQPWAVPVMKMDRPNRVAQLLVPSAVRGGRRSVLNHLLLMT